MFSFVVLWIETSFPPPYTGSFIHHNWQQWQRPESATSLIDCSRNRTTTATGIPVTLPVVVLQPHLDSSLRLPTHKFNTVTLKSIQLPMTLAGLTYTMQLINLFKLGLTALWLCGWTRKVRWADGDYNNLQLWSFHGDKGSEREPPKSYKLQSPKTRTNPPRKKGNSSTDATYSPSSPFSSLSLSLFHVFFCSI